MAVITFGASSDVAAQTAFDGRGGGAIIVGYDSRSCDPAIEGAIRYNSANKKIQVCTPGNSCINIGDMCVDGSVFAGLSPDGSAPMYTTPADAGQFSWNNGTTTYVATGMQNCTSGSPGAEASCRAGAANTALLVALGTTPSPAPYIAARHCDNLNAHGHTDWYLPAQDELNVLRTNRVVIGGFSLAGTFPNGHYWSSSPQNNSFVRNQNFQGGTQGSNNLENALNVRCVRKSITPPVVYTWTEWGG